MKLNILKPLTVETAPEAARPILANIQKNYGFVPNLMATFANSPAVIQGYLALDGEWEKGTFTPAERALILLTVSVANDCNYCAAGHSMFLKKALNVPAEVVAAVRSKTPLADAKLNALVNYVSEIVNERGHVSQETLQQFLNAGYTKPQAVEVLLGVALKTISNYFDHINPATLDAVFQSEAGVTVSA